MKIKALQLTVVLALAFASNSMASLIGSTYDFATSQTGNTTIGGSGPAFCVGPNDNSCAGSGLFGSFSFADVDSTDATITFGFTGSTNETDGTFSVHLNNLTTPDGSLITSITYASGNLSVGNFSSVSWDGTNAVFTGTSDDFYDAVGGQSVVFNVALQPQDASAPEPGSLWLSGLGLAGLAAFAVKRRVRA